jgi:holo-[acyl-carrier protein] synthase
MHEPAAGFRKSDTRRGEQMVVGLGTDLVEIERIEDSIARFGERFLARVFTPDEIAFCSKKKNAAESFAARFAAKEAAAKALGTGISRGVSWQDIEVVRRPGERPEIVFHGRAAERARVLGAVSSTVSLTHSREVAMAVVILER